MSHSKNKVEWCLRKAEIELRTSDTHRGLVSGKPEKEKAKEHIRKAEHYLEATIYLKKGNFSDISASTVFYSMYHCLLAIAADFGYESRNQECTFALIGSLIEDDKIDLDKQMMAKICYMDIKDGDERTVLKVREQYQYGTGLSLKENIYDENLELAKTILMKTKELLVR